MSVKAVCLAWALGLTSIAAAGWVVMTCGMPAPVVAFGAGMLFLMTTMNWWMGFGK